MPRSLLIQFVLQLVTVAHLFCFPFDAIAQNQSASTAPAFSHCFLVVDSTTFHAIEASPFLKDSFAFTSTITSSVNAGKQTYSGLYLFGRQTYLEIFIQDKKQPLGACGIGFQVERPGALQSLSDSLHKQFNFSFSPRTRKGSDGLEYIYAYKSDIYGNEQDTGQLFSSWIMEFDTTYMKSRFSQKHPNDITRETFQQRRYKKDLYVKDVTKITVHLPRKDEQYFVNIAKALGYNIRRRRSSTLVSNNDFTMVIMRATNKNKGIGKIEVRLNKPKTRQTKYLFGNAILQFKDNEATWLFNYR